MRAEMKENDIADLMSRKFAPPTEPGEDRTLLYPDDGLLVGTDAIFSSPNVVPPPGARRPREGEGVPLPPEDDGVPAPSIYRDVRGEIHNVRAGGRRINILHTRAGHLRSGDLHPNDQCDFVFSGRIRVWTLAPDGSTAVDEYGKNEFAMIPRGTPHVFEFLEHTVMAEWWEPQGFQCWFYRPYRDIVDLCMRESAGGDGLRMSRKGLVVLGPSGDRGASALALGFGAVIVGFVGFALGSKFGGRRS